MYLLRAVKNMFIFVLVPPQQQQQQTPLPPPSPPPPKKKKLMAADPRGVSPLLMPGFFPLLFGFNSREDTWSRNKEEEEEEEEEEETEEKPLVEMKAGTVNLQFMLST